jgi:hypothetical protein
VAVIPTSRLYIPKPVNPNILDFSDEISILMEDCCFQQYIGLKFKRETSKVLRLECGAETGALGKLDREHLGSFEMWWWGEAETSVGPIV